MERVTLFADVILPLPLPNLFTYRVPFGMNERLQPGQRVAVQFGKNKLYSALVRKIHQRPPAHYEAKYLEAVLDEIPVVNEKQFRLWEWMSAYYMCTPGEVMNAALPSGLKLESETRILLRQEAEPVPEGGALQGNSEPEKKWEDVLNDEEYLVAETLLSREVMTINDVTELLEKKSVHGVIQSLLKKEIIVIQEELKEKYHPKIIPFVKLTAFAADEANMQEIMNDLEKRAFRQLELLLAFVRLLKEHKKDELKKSELLKISEAGEAALNALVKKDILEIVYRTADRLEMATEGSRLISPSPHQQAALEKIREQLKEKEVVLLHGVTSSGKTELYVKLIEETIAAGKQVLYLLPEIALTTQIIGRLRNYFGSRVGVYHSRFNENERVEIWNNLTRTGPSSQNTYEVILGARSALFLPFSNIGLVIIDEEHDASYKQFDPAPRYHARDTAIYLAHIHGAKTIIGSATPSVESTYNAGQGKYGSAELRERFGGMQMPEIIIADIKKAAKQGEMKSHFTSLLLDHIALALKQKEQVILFQNRRGFAPRYLCETCGWSPQCINCDVSLTYHKSVNQLRCHYCGYAAKPPQKCSACGNDRLRLVGFGTEKIEEELSIFFPEAKIARMDLDSTRSKFAHRQIISDFEERNTDILVGTQMVTKGLDFDHVNVVGILNADSMLGFPDFRAYERAYQLMAQVAGRAGRKNKRGKVIIQTRQPDHPVILHVLNNDFISMYREQLTERKTFHYPPFYRLIEIVLLHKNIDQVNHSAEFLSSLLKTKLGNRIIGPAFPLVSRIRNQYHKSILVKIEKESSVSRVKELISESFSVFRNDAEHKGVRIQVNVDPV